MAKKKQQESRSVMICAGIFDQTILDHSKSMKESNWIVLIIVILWIRLSLHGTNPSLAVSNWSVQSCIAILLMYRRLPMNSLSIKDLQEKILEWLQSSPDLNLIVNLWLIIKMKLYDDGKQYKSKANLWETIKTDMLEIEIVEEEKS